MDRRQPQRRAHRDPLGTPTPVSVDEPHDPQPIRHRLQRGHIAVRKRAHRQRPGGGGAQPFQQSIGRAEVQKWYRPGLAMNAS